MADLIALLRNNQCFVKYSKEYYETRTPDGASQMPDDKLLENVIELNCSNRQLTSLPQLPNCQILYCHNNQLTSLPHFPNCKALNCSNNQLTSLPQLPNCILLWCYDNQLTSLPQLPNIRSYGWSNNCLPFGKLAKWKIIWKTRRLYLQIKYFRLWYKFMLHSKARVKVELHNELKYSPNLQFYKNTEEYEHWHNCLQQSH